MSIEATLILLIGLLWIGLDGELHVWSPQWLREISQTSALSYSIANIGKVPYGHSLYGKLRDGGKGRGVEALRGGFVFVQLEEGESMLSATQRVSIKNPEMFIFALADSRPFETAIWAEPFDRNALSLIECPGIVVSTSTGIHLKTAMDRGEEVVLAVNFGQPRLWRVKPTKGAKEDESQWEKRDRKSKKSDSKKRRGGGDSQREPEGVDSPQGPEASSPQRAPDPFGPPPTPPKPARTQFLISPDDFESLSALLGVLELRPADFSWGAKFYPPGPAEPPGACGVLKERPLCGRCSIGDCFSVATAFAYISSLGPRHTIEFITGLQRKCFRAGERVAGFVECYFSILQQRNPKIDPEVADPSVFRELRAENSPMIFISGRPVKGYFDAQTTLDFFCEIRGLCGDKGRDFDLTKIAFFGFAGAVFAFWGRRFAAKKAIERRNRKLEELFAYREESVEEELDFLKL